MHLRNQRFGYLCFLPFLLLLFFSPEVSFSNDVTEGSLDMIIVLDTSMSMRGVGGTDNIFVEVLGVCKDIVSELQQGDTITLITFDEEVYVYPTVSLLSDVETQRVLETIDSFSADGNWTYTSLALQRALSEADRFESLFPHHTKVVVILTDGINDPPPEEIDNGPTLDAAASPYQDRPWFVYQVQLGSVTDPGLTSAMSYFPNAHIFKRGENFNLRDLTETVTTVDDPEPEPEPEPDLEPVELSWIFDREELLCEITTSDIYFADTIFVNLSPDINAHLPELSLEYESFPDWLLISFEDISCEDYYALVFFVQVTDEALNGDFNLNFELESYSSDSIFWNSTILPVSIKIRVIPPVWPLWLGGIFLVILVSYLLFRILKSLRESKLFGALLFWPEGDQAASEKADLSEYGRQAVVGTDIPVNANLKELCVLRVSKCEGIFLVTVYPAETGCSIMHNGMTQFKLPLYNQTKFTIEGTTFQYSGPVPARN